MRPPIFRLIVPPLLAAMAGFAQTSKAPPKPQAEKFVERIARALGIAYSPGALKGPGDEVRSGGVWLADVAGGTRRALTEDNGYRSPIFLVSGDVLALRGADVVRISAKGEIYRLQTVNGAMKLVGAEVDNSDFVLILLRNGSGGHPLVAQLALSTGRVTTLPYDPNSREDVQLVEDLQGWTRAYGIRRVYVKKMSKQDLAGTVEWTDVFVETGGQGAVNVSRCEGANCGQPALSADGRSVVFVKGTGD